MYGNLVAIVLVKMNKYEGTIFSKKVIYNQLLRSGSNKKNFQLLF